MLRKILLLTGGLLIAGLLFIPWFFSGLNTQTAPDYSADESVFGISSVSTTLRDDTGIPFITSSSENDFAFSLGYLHAQDRLWQMSWLRTEMKGETAKILGKNAIEWDLLVKMLGIETRAADLVKSLSEVEKQRLQAYTSGVNEFIRIHETRLPFEFALLNQKPEPWKPEHSAGILLLYKWRYLIPEFKRKLLPLIMSLPDYRAFQSVLIPGSLHSSVMNTLADSSLTGTHYQAPSWLLDENGWLFSLSAFGEQLTGTGKPMIMINQKGSNNLPVDHYPVSGRVGENLTGLLCGLPGTPWFLAGIQKDQTWIVSGFSDSLEVGIVNVPPQALRVPLSIEVEGVNKFDFLVPVLSSTILLPKMLTGFPVDSLQVYLRGINWDMKNEIPLLSGIPGQKIAFTSPGSVRFKVIQNEKTATSNWADRLLSENDTLSLYQIKNLAKSVKTDSSLFDLIYTYRKNGHFEIGDFQNLQELLSGIDGLRIKNRILPVFANDTSNYIVRNLVYLNSWQGELDQKSIGTSVYFTWKYMFLKNWLQEELGSDQFLIWISDFQNSDRVFNTIFAGNDSLSNINLPVTGEPVDLAVKHAFEDAIRYLQNNLGVNSFNWRWENVNQANLSHKLEQYAGDFPLKITLTDGQEPSNPIFNAPLFSNERQLFSQVNLFSAGSNFINPNLVYLLSPAGISGNPKSPFFSNFSENWSDQVWTVFNTGPVQNQPAYTLILRPGK